MGIDGVPSLIRGCTISTLEVFINANPFVLQVQGENKRLKMAIFMIKVAKNEIRYQRLLKVLLKVAKVMNL